MSKKKRTRRNIPPATLLRPRMEDLFSDDTFLSKEDAALQEELNALTQGVSDRLFVKTLLRAYAAASEAVQARLGEILPGWLAANDHIKILQTLTEDRSLGPDLRPQALTWLDASGTDTTELEKIPDLFLNAYYYDDEDRLSDLSQAYTAIFWYTDTRRRRAQAMTFLLDYNPPWDGSVKDIIVSPQKPPDQVLKRFHSTWDNIDMSPDSISPAHLKTVVLKALACNREAEVRLPRDLINARDLFEEQILSLPDEPETPTFTMADFDWLAAHGERPENIMAFEQAVGRRVRIGDDEELLVIGSDWDEEEWAEADERWLEDDDLPAIE
jgi:hypothetical protein